MALLGVVIDDAREMLMVTEYMANGNLASYLIYFCIYFHFHFSFLLALFLERICIMFRMSDLSANKPTCR